MHGQCVYMCVFPCLCSSTIYAHVYAHIYVYIYMCIFMMCIYVCETTCLFLALHYNTVEGGKYWLFIKNVLTKILIFNYFLCILYTHALKVIKCVLC